MTNLKDHGDHHMSILIPAKGYDDSRGYRESP